MEGAVMVRGPDSENVEVFFTLLADMSTLLVPVILIGPAGSKNELTRTSVPFLNSTFPDSTAMPPFCPTSKVWLDIVKVPGWPERVTESVALIVMIPDGDP